MTIPFLISLNYLMNTKYLKYFFYLIVFKYLYLFFYSYININDSLTHENGIRVFRLSSEMFQHKTNPKVPDYDFDFAWDLLRQIGDRSRELNQRLTFHPGQYNCIGSPKEDVIASTTRDLKYHADVLDLMNLDA